MVQVPWTDTGYGFNFGSLQNHIYMCRSTDCIEIHNLDVDFYSSCPWPAQWMEESERKASLFWLTCCDQQRPLVVKQIISCHMTGQRAVLHGIFFKRDWIREGRLAVRLSSSKYFGQIWHLKVSSAVAVALLTRKWPWFKHLGTTLGSIMTNILPGQWNYLSSTPPPRPPPSPPRLAY